MKNMVYDGWHKIEILNSTIKGKDVQREFLHLLGGVGAVITDEEGKIGLVKQLRPAIDQFTFEIPAGALDKEGLSDLEILLEELEEECRLSKDDILSISDTLVKKFLMLVGSSDSYMHLYRVHVKKQPSFVEVDDVDVEGVYWFTFDEFEQMFLNGEIVDNKTVMSYLLLKIELSK